MKNKTAVTIVEEPIRALYKIPDKAPTVKIITDIEKIKNLIVKNVLKMIRYDNYIIVCIASQQNNGLTPNIVLNFESVFGEFYFMAYDKEKNDFRSLTLSEINKYAQELSQKSFNSKKQKKFFERNLARQKNKQKEMCMNIKDNVKFDEDKVTIVPIKEGETDPAVVEFQKNMYSAICTKLGLDPARGQIVFEKSRDDDTGEDVSVDYMKNKITLSPSIFDEYKKKEELEFQKNVNDNSQVNTKNVSDEISDRDILKLMLKVQIDILNFIKIYMSNKNND